MSDPVRGFWVAMATPLTDSGAVVVAHWNPVLHVEAQRVWLFYKVGPDARRRLHRCGDELERPLAFGCGGYDTAAI